MDSILPNVLLTVTPATIGGAVVVGIILGTVFLPSFGRAIGSSAERGAWGAVVGMEVMGLTFLVGTMVARLLDGSPVWAAWLGVVGLWTVMSVAAGVSLKIVGR